MRMNARLRDEFFAEQVAGYVEDEVCIVAFAETSDPDPSRYAIFSESLYDDSQDEGEEGMSFSFEMAGIDVPPFASISLISIAPDHLIVRGANDTNAGIEVLIKYAPDHYSLLKEHMPKIVAKSSTRLEIQ